MTTPHSDLHPIPLEPAQVDSSGNILYVVTETPLKSGGRRDLVVHNARVDDATDRSGIVDQLRAFFASVDAEAHRYASDPMTNVQALAKVEALLADLRFVRDTLRKLTADALMAQKIRRLTVEGVITVEGTKDTKRTGWQDHRLLTDMIDATVAEGLVDRATGEMVDGAALASIVLAWMRPEWRLTPIREAGLDPNMYCEVDFDDQGRVAGTASLRIVDNLERA